MSAALEHGHRPIIDWQELCDLGFNLIPVRVGEKIPAIQWARFQTERASSEEIERWQREGHNAGIVTGVISGIVVLDCDTPEAIERAKYLGIPAGTISVKTAKGCHYYFRHPGFAVSNRANLFPGMDIRGDGGFVVAPGSLHPSGSIYRWADDPAWSEKSPVPDWLLNLLQRKSVEQTRPAKSAGSSGHSPYGQRALDRELTILRNAPEGSRNHQLNRSAFALAQLAAGGQIDAEAAQAALDDAGHAIGLDQLETSKTLASGWQAGLQQPRAPAAADAQPTNGPKIISARDLAEMTFAPMQWALPRILPEGLALLAGKPKLGKSFLALQLAIAVATGEARTFGVPEIDAGDVLFCALEDSERRLKDRLTRQYPFGGTPERLHFATSWPRIGEGGIEELTRWCDDHPATRLIILDTWRAVKPLGTGRGSAYDEDANAAAPLLEFAKDRPGLAILVIHHVRKSEADDIFDMISGTHGLTGIFDTLMVLSRHGQGAKLAAQGRDLEGYEKALDRDQRTGGWIVRGDANALAKTGERQELIDVLAKAKVALSLAEIAAAVGKKPDAVRHLLKPLVEEGSIYQPRHGQYAQRPPQFVQDAQFDVDQAY
jgi:DNA-binding transcriptional ArsR family regulator